MKQNTKEWLQMRKNFVCGSDAPIIMEVSPFKRSDGLRKTPYVLWMEKLDLLPIETETSAMRYGKEMEEPARHFYEEKVGDLFSPKVCFHKDINYLMASLDGISIDGKKIVEIKNANAEDHSLAKAKKIPAKYYPQLQHQLACTGLDGMHYFSFHKEEGVIVEVDRDDNYLEEMYAKEKEFWDCVTNFKAPALTDNDYRERDKKWYIHANKLLEIKEKRKALEKEENEAEDLLRSMSGGQSSFFNDVRYTCGIRKGNVNYRQIPELKEVDLEKYRKPNSITWSLVKR